jgi:hypothetical protein
LFLKKKKKSAPDLLGLLGAVAASKGEEKMTPTA